jgi:lipoyl(octanoyl) transferase
MNQILAVNIGRTKYADAWELQKKIFAARLDRKIPDVLLLTEHEHVFTLGKGADENHLLASQRELNEKGIDVFSIDRGGDVTYHGPGQLVGYPILDLNNYYLDIHRYLRDIEEVLIRTIEAFGAQGVRSEGYTGVWAKDEKIAAIGIKVSRWISMHGFALNVNTDLSYFDRIIPCGIFHKGVTSLRELTGRKQDLNDVASSVIENFGSVFSVSPRSVTFEELGEILNLNVPEMIEEHQ